MGATGGFNGQHGMVGVLLYAYELVVPAQVDQRQLCGALSQKAFYIVLLQVDEGGALVTSLGQQVKFVDLLAL